MRYIAQHKSFITYTLAAKSKDCQVIPIPVTHMCRSLYVMQSIFTFGAINLIRMVQNIGTNLDIDFDRRAVVLLAVLFSL